VEGVGRCGPVDGRRQGRNLGVDDDPSAFKCRPGKV
jgi:hypothetical protein